MHDPKRRRDISTISTASTATMWMILILILLNQISSANTVLISLI